MSQNGNFRVIIAGGGLAGLTLANALQHTGIDYLLLESRSNIAPQIGGSIGLAPNGSRILDQLSCYEEVEKLTEPIESMGNHAANGDDLLPRSDGFQLLHARCVRCVPYTAKIFLQLMSQNKLSSFLSRPSNHPSNSRGTYT